MFWKSLSRMERFMWFLKVLGISQVSERCCCLFAGRGCSMEGERTVREVARDHGHHYFFT